MNFSNGLARQTHPEERRIRLIETIYATVADPGAWQAFLQEIIGCTNSRSARMLVLNPQADRVLSSIKQNIDDSFHRQYTEHYVNACPWRPELVRKAPGRLYSTYLHFSCRQPDYLRTEFFNDWAGPQDIHHGVCGTIFKNSHRTVQLLVQRTGGQGHYTEEDTDFINGFVPHLQHAFLLAAQVADQTARSEALAAAAGGESLPFMLLDHTLRPVHCNPGAEELLGSGSALRLVNGQLQLADGRRNQTLQRLLRECLAAADSRTFDSAGGILEVPRPDRADLQLLIRPIHPDIPILSVRPEGYVAVYVYDPEAKVAIDRTRLSALYGLSGAETRIALAMLDTPEPAEVAKRCFISLHTVRSHLKSIFAKTGTGSQAELMRLLLTGPARKR
ncbi:MAG: LuxR family transcriptional regulator [Syntrophotaleaceae bacterium]